MLIKILVIGPEDHEFSVLRQWSMDWRNSAETSEGRSSEERRLGAERGCWVGWSDSGTNRDEAFFCWSPSQHLRELGASNKACHVGGVAIQARGKPQHWMVDALCR